jgi:hypothetical protein
MARHCAARPDQGKHGDEGEKQGLWEGIEEPAMRRGQQQQRANIDEAAEQKLPERRPSRAVRTSVFVLLAMMVLVVAAERIII